MPHATGFAPLGMGALMPGNSTSASGRDIVSGTYPEPDGTDSHADALSVLAQCLNGVAKQEV